jgi:hypothetical protein
LLFFLAALAFFKSIAPVDDEARLLPRKREATSDPALHVRRAPFGKSGPREGSSALLRFVL